MIKNFFSHFLLTFSLFTGMTLMSTAPVNAETAPKLIASGTENTSITWSLYDNGELKFTGSGSINDYYDSVSEQTTGRQGWYRYRRNTEKIIIGEGITAIGDGAFLDFPESEVLFPVSGLTEIGKASFANNTNLEKIVLPTSVSVIGEGAFKNCSSANEITIKGAVSVIEKETFTGMKDAIITVANGCTTVKSKAFFGSAGRIDFPSTVHSIAPDSLDRNNKWKLVKGHSNEVKLLANNNYIPYIDAGLTYPLDPKKISINAVSYDYTGKKITPSITVRYSDGQDTSNLIMGKDYVLYFGSDNSKNLGKHSVEVRGIGNFTGKKTVSYTINANIEDCDVSLEYTSISSNGSSRKPKVSVSCNGLKLVKGTHYSVSYSNNIEPGEANVTVKGISKNFAIGSLDESFTIFEKKRFYYDDCIYMVTGVTEDSTQVMLADADVTSTSYTIPSNIKFKGEEYEVVSIGQYAFKNCKSLKKVTIGKNIKTIGDGAFYGCKNLKSIKLPINLESIGNKVFINCLSLESVTIPSKVKSIGKSAFLGCKLLRSVTINTSKLTSANIGSSAFKNIHRKAVVYVPSTKLTDYKKILNKKGLTGSAQKVVAIR